MTSDDYDYDSDHDKNVSDAIRKIHRHMGRL
jgi:hypothetical protein